MANSIKLIPDTNGFVFSRNGLNYRFPKPLFWTDTPDTDEVAFVIPNNTTYRFSTQDDIWIGDADDLQHLSGSHDEKVAAIVSTGIFANGGMSFITP